MVIEIGDHSYMQCGYNFTTHCYYCYFSGHCI